MRPYSSFVVSPTLPQSLSPLKEIAYNYWWCWHANAIALFREIDKDLWDEVHHNPVELLCRVSRERLHTLAEQPDFLTELQSVYQDFRAYMDGKGWYSTIEHSPTNYIAYFCAEFGIHESFSIYSGGLGVLAGDHLKSASDLGIPLIGIGLLYQQGYFKQYLTQNGWQNEQYLEVDFHSLPLTVVTKSDGQPLVISVMLKNEECFAQLWRTNVGRVPLYLLDTNIEQNETPELRNVTDRLYGGSVEDRIRQEIVLGIGGVRALQALGIEPAVCHINEGHAGFSMLERCKQFMTRYNLTFEEALQGTSTTNVFTTHTPVPAGNEVFEHEMLSPYFTEYAKGLNLTYQEFSLLGATSAAETSKGFSMTVLGLNASTYRNGVSQLHGDVSRKMWHDVWKDFPLNEVPIAGLTNGIHNATWVANEIAELYDRYLGPQWRTQPHIEESWQRVHEIPNEELWNAHCKRRTRLVLGARHHIISKHTASLTHEQISNINDCLDPDVLTIGFARRFASYKRATLLMHDIERLRDIVNNTDRPVQFILAGKAHPKDTQGKELIQSVYQLISHYNLSDRIVFLEDYNMDVARLMVRGCDVWLNTPRRPFEASGTSGMKAAVNGVLNCSILDGWWSEAYDGENGFAIGRGEELEPDEQDTADALTLYDQLEHLIIPAFYENGKGNVSAKWMTLMKHSISSLSWRFSALRMVHDYTVRTYLPAMRSYHTLNSQSGQPARDAVIFATMVEAEWPNVHVPNVDADGIGDAVVGQVIKVQAEVKLGKLNASDVIVQIIHGRLDASGEIQPALTSNMECIRQNEDSSMFQGEYTCDYSGMQGFTVRVVPTHHMIPFVADGKKIAFPARPN
ncbi:MAG: alpha-glucan family phosphorylase [Ignavibacteria bacterium]|nr:alpha-glucan family phosphorylase [Ignavibacteria bacterium]